MATTGGLGEILGLILVLNIGSMLYEMFKNRWWCVLSRVFAILLVGVLGLMLMATMFLANSFFGEDVSLFNSLWLLVPIVLLNLAILPLGRVAQDKTKVPLLVAIGSLLIGVFGPIFGLSSVGPVCLFAFVASIVVGLVLRILIAANPTPKTENSAYDAPQWRVPTPLLPPDATMPPQPRPPVTPWPPASPVRPQATAPPTPVPTLPLIADGPLAPISPFVSPHLAPSLPLVQPPKVDC